MIEYSDGERSERAVLEILKKASRLDSLCPIAKEQYADWAIRYHLTPERGNLLRHLSFSGLDVLELGAGMGGVSRVLAENARSLTVVEGTDRRFEALSYRLRDLSNWKGQVANIQDASLDRKFDVICVIGVLEYSELYWKTENGVSPFEAFLKQVRNWLTPEGALVLAIENRLGIKYWAGASEDHTGRMFDGICGYSNQKTPRTFSRKELEVLFRESGLGILEEFYPFPDYKIPASVISKRLSQANPSLAAEIAVSQSFENYLQTRVHYFPEELALSGMAKAGLFEEVANSFLFVASVGGKASAVTEKLLSKVRKEEVGWHYSRNRLCPVTTVFSHSGTSPISISKHSSVSESQRETWKAQGIHWEACNAPVLSSGKVSESFERKIYFESVDAGFDYLVRFLGQTLETLQLTPEELKPESLDALWTNATESEGKFGFFDLEWNSLNPVSVHWWLLRNILPLRRYSHCLTPNSFADSLRSLYLSVCGRLGIVANFEEAVRLEAKFQACVTWNSVASEYEAALLHDLSQPFSSRKWTRTPVEEKQRRDWEDLGRLLHVQLAVKLARRLHAKISKLPRLKAFLKKALQTAFRLNQRRKQLKSKTQDLREGWNLVRVETDPEFVGEVICRFQVRGIELQSPLKAREKGVYSELIKMGETASGFSLLVDKARIRKFSIRHLRKEEAAIRLLLAQGTKGLNRTLRSLRQTGLKQIPQVLQQEALRGDFARVDYYQPWVKKYDTLSESERTYLKREVHSWENCPLISVVMPVFNTEETYLRKALDSVLQQIYPHWELCIADDASQAPHVRKVLEEYRKRDPRVRVEYRATNGHIAEASETALKMAAGEWVTFLDHDDELSETALYWVAREARENGDVQLFYSDEDKIDTLGRRFSPHFKGSVVNRHLFYSYNQLTHLVAMKGNLAKSLGFRGGFEGAQDYDLFLRAFEQLGNSQIRHIPRVLYHWRVIPGSTSGDSGAKSYATQNGKKALESHFQRTGIRAEVLETGEGNFRVKYALPENLPKVSVVIGTRDRVELLSVIVDGLLQETDYSNLEVIIVDNDSKEQATLDYFAKIESDSRVRVIQYPYPFNFSAINNFGVAHATGEILALLNNDLKVIHSDWLKEMVSYFARPEVGAVGAKLYYPNGKVQHAGVVLGIGQLAGEKHGVAGHIHRNAWKGEPGYMRRLLVHQNLACVTAACVLVRKSAFEAVGGFEEDHLPVAFNDVDLCLKLRKKGLEIIWTPFSELLHFESASRGSDLSPENRHRFERECHWMIRRWKKELEMDPFYSPNLTLEREDFSYAFPPRVEALVRSSRPSPSKDQKMGATPTAPSVKNPEIKNPMIAPDI